MMRRMLVSQAVAWIAIAALLSSALFATGAESPSTPTNPPPAPVCTVGQYSVLPMDTQADGTIAVPASVNGHSVEFLVDTGSVFSSVTFIAASELGLREHASAFRGEFLNGVQVSSFTQVDSFKLGDVPYGATSFLLAPYTVANPNMSGLLGPDIMKQFDVEFDFAAAKLHLLAPNSCPLAPVYWTHDAYAQVPMTVDPYMHIRVTAQLDGRPVNVAVDTGSGRSTMSLEAARSLFGWADNDPKLKSLPAERINGGEPVPMWHYPFAALTFEGIQVVNPDIDLIPQKNFGERTSQIVLGMSVLRQLHVYVGYKSQTLYLTAAEAH
jgi:predicted aspartyl protease